MAYSKYRSILENLLKRMVELTDEMPSVARCMRLIGLSAEAMEVKNIFENDVLKRTKNGPTLDVDIDVNYEEWAKKDWPMLDNPPKNGYYKEPEQYFKPDDDPQTPGAYEDRLLRYYPQPFQEKMNDTNKDKVKDSEKYKDEGKIEQQDLYSFKAHEQLRTLVSIAHVGKMMKEEHVTQATNTILNELKNVLLLISDSLGAKYSDEEYEKLYQEERLKNMPQMKRGKDAYEEWVEDQCYNEPSIEDLEDYRITILMELFNIGIFASNVEEINRAQKKKGEIDFDTLDEERNINFAWKNYSVLRRFYNYEDGLLKLHDTNKIGRFFYKQRKEERAKELREAFFMFDSKLRHSQEKLEELRRINRDREQMLTPKRQQILNILDDYIDEGNWQKPATVDGVKQWMKTILNIGEKTLDGEELEMSKSLWGLFEKRKGDATMVTFQNIVGYLHYYDLLPKSIKSPQLQIEFFGKEDSDKYTNIDKGKPSSDFMPEGFKNVLPLLDKYRKVFFR